MISPMSVQLITSNKQNYQIEYEQLQPKGLEIDAYISNPFHAFFQGVTTL